jgi:arginase
MTAQPRRVDVIGVPFNSAGTADGVARAPGALRHAGLLEALRDVGIDAVDTGDVQLGRTSARRDPRTHLIAPMALVAMIRAVRTRVATSTRSGAFPLVIGGDCPVLLGCLGARGDEVANGLLFVDGHEDAWPPERSTTGEAADMELGFALGLTVAGLPEELDREIPRVARDAIVALGPRDEREIAEAGVPSIADVVTIVRPDQLAAHPEEVASAAVASFGLRPGWWLHVDLDVLSTDSLDAVDYRQPGGIGWDVLTRLTRTALAQPGALGWDVTIFNPDLDPDGTGARRIVRYLAEALTR